MNLNMPSFSKWRCSIDSSFPRASHDVTECSCKLGYSICRRRSFQHRDAQHVIRNFDTSSCSSHIIFNSLRANADGCTGIERTCTRYAGRVGRTLIAHAGFEGAGACASGALRNSRHCLINCLMSALSPRARCSISGQKSSPQRGSSRTDLSNARSQNSKTGTTRFLTLGNSVSGRKSHKRHATATRRMVGSEYNTCKTTHAGHPSAIQKSRSSVKMEWSQVKASRASLRNARSGSAPRFRPRARVAIWVA